MDAADPLAPLRDRFTLPEGVVYLDGNSLGPVPKGTAERLQQAVTQEWGEGLIRSWNAAGWIDLPRRVGDKIGRLIGARPGEVVVADSTSVNLFKVLSAAVKLNPDRRVILSERENFPTDLYMAQGLIQLLGQQHELRLVGADEIVAALDDDTAVLMLTHVNYRTGRMFDMASITAEAHAHGALMLWDLAHSVGAVPVDVTAAQADFAVGCGYKYLNGGPGAPAFVYVAERHQPRFSQPLSGWLGHAQPFEFSPYYRPAEGIARYLCGTQPVLSLTALECGVDSVLDADMDLIRHKSLALTDLFIQLVEDRCAGYGLELVTPREHERRGSQVCLRHPQGYPIMQALISRGVIGDFRAPDILRFGLAPLYLRYVDVWDAVAHLADILATRAWDQPQFQQRATVT
ncbi:MAG: kynureninase [Anaerolineae bacterium]|nr:kynureninase [Anaerolineae bacterium]